MAQKEQTTASPASTGNSMGLKSFNRTGQENTTTEVIRPVVRPETRRRNALLIAVVVVAIVVMAAMAQQRSKLPFIPSGDSDQPTFGQQRPNMNPDSSDQ